jgi:hypothetical protein
MIHGEKVLLREQSAKNKLTAPEPNLHELPELYKLYNISFKIAKEKIVLPVYIVHLGKVLHSVGNAAHHSHLNHNKPRMRIS